MPTRKTDAEIVAEIQELIAARGKVRQRTAFGEDNHDAINAQIAVLRERMSHDDVYDAWGDEGSEEFSQHILDAALEARDWMDGTRADSEPSPAKGWVP